MIKKVFVLYLLIKALPAAACAQSILGDWQGTPTGSRGLKAFPTSRESLSGKVGGIVPGW